MGYLHNTRLANCENFGACKITLTGSPPRESSSPKRQLAFCAKGRQISHHHSTRVFLFSQGGADNMNALSKKNRSLLSISYPN